MRNNSIYRISFYPPYFPYFVIFVHITIIYINNPQKDKTGTFIN